MLNIVPLLIFLVLLGALLKVSFVLHVIYLILGVFLLARLSSRWAMRGVRAWHAFEPYAMLGDRVEVRLRIRNNSLLPLPWLSVHDRLPHRLVSPPHFNRVISLMPHEEAIYPLSLTCRHRGYYPIGPISLQSGDLLGFEEHERHAIDVSYLTVYPKIVSLQELGFPSRSPFGHLSAHQRIYEDPSRVVGVRDYLAGDSWRSVNWKVSAQVGRLQVKKLEPAITLDTVILLNLSAREYSVHRLEYSTENAITVAASIANHLTSLRQQVGLITNGVDLGSPDGEQPELIGLPARKGQGHLMRLLQLLARLEHVQRERIFAEVVQGMARRLAWGATLVIITPSETADLLNTCLSLREMGFNLVLVYVDRPNRAVLSSQSRAAGFLTYHIWNEEDFNVWRRQQREFAA